MNAPSLSFISDDSRSDFSSMMDDFRARGATVEFKNQWADHPQLGLWLETAWHAMYRFQLHLFSQFSQNQTPYSSIFLPDRIDLPTPSNSSSNTFLFSTPFSQINKTDRHV